MAATTKQFDGGVINLLPWQQRFISDAARIKIGCVHRQGGKDFVTAADATWDAFENGQNWYIVSITQRQADATFKKCRDFVTILKKVMKAQLDNAFEDSRDFVEHDKEINEIFRCTARTIYFPSGGSVTALPGRDPDTLAGLTGNVIFTEFGLFPNGGYDHWRVVFPLITRGFRIIVISTPRGKNTKFFELVNTPDEYSVHLQTIEDSVREGFTLRDNKGNQCGLEKFRSLYGDDAGWRREYMCEFTGDLDALVKWAELVNASRTDCETLIIRIKNDSGYQPGMFRKLDGRLELGWDVARHGDVSAMIANEKTNNGRWLRYLVIMQNCKFDLQRTVLKDAMGADGRNVGCGDATGLGMDSNETLHTLYGDRWEPVTFSQKTKSEMASAAKTAIDDNDQMFPDINGEAKFLHTDIYALQAEKTKDRVQLATTPNPLLPESHCDIAMAWLLARRAALSRSGSANIWVADI